MPTKETIDAVAFYANVATLVAAPLGLFGLAIAIRALWAARRAGSAAALIALNESFRQAWLQHTLAPEDRRSYTFSDVMNLLELACAIYKDKLFVARGGRLLRDYLFHVLKLIEQNDDTRPRIQEMFLTPRTFEHITNFLKQHRSDFRRLQDS